MVAFCLVGPLLTSCNKTVSKSGMKDHTHPQEQPLPKELIQGITNSIHNIHLDSINPLYSIKEFTPLLLSAIEEYKKCIVCGQCFTPLGYARRDGLNGSCTACALFFKYRFSKFGPNPKNWPEHHEKCPKSKEPYIEKEENSYINMSEDGRGPQSNRRCTRCRYEICCMLYCETTSSYSKVKFNAEPKTKRARHLLEKFQT